MGEFADMTIDRDLENYVDFYQNTDKYLNEWEGEEIPLIKADKWTALEFKEIKRETDKSWLLIMSGMAETWFPKSKCKIKNNIILVPKWLLNKKAGWE